MSCTECNARVPAEAEACPECGYPIASSAPAALHEESEAAHALKEYRLIQLLGIIVAGAGTAAAFADSPLAAAVAITIGVGTYVIGLLGAWWNTGD